MEEPKPSSEAPGPPRGKDVWGWCALPSIGGQRAMPRRKTFVYVILHTDVHIPVFCWRRLSLPTVSVCSSESSPRD